MTTTATQAVVTPACATCGAPAVRSAHDTTMWVHEPTPGVRWSLPEHRVSIAR